MIRSRNVWKFHCLDFGKVIRPINLECSFDDWGKGIDHGKNIMRQQRRKEKLSKLTNMIKVWIKLRGNYSDNLFQNSMSKLNPNLKKEHITVCLANR